MRKIIGDLNEWGAFIIKHLDHATEMGENVIHRVSEYGYTDPQPATDKILCADMPSRLQQIDIAVNRLGGLEQAAVTLTYCAPVKEDGGVYTKSELARICGVNKGRFRAALRRGQDRLERVRLKKKVKIVASALT